MLPSRTPFGKLFSSTSCMWPSNCSLFYLVIFDLLFSSNCLRNSLLYPILHVLFSCIGLSTILDSFLSNACRAGSDFLAKVQLSLACHDAGFIAVLYSLIFVRRCTTPDLMLGGNEKGSLFAWPILVWISISPPAFALWFDPRYTKSLIVKDLWFWHTQRFLQDGLDWKKCVHSFSDILYYSARSVKQKILKTCRISNLECNKWRSRDKGESWNCGLDVTGSEHSMVAAFCGQSNELRVPHMQGMPWPVSNCPVLQSK
jgi:hypothetical protein